MLVDIELENIFITKIINGQLAAGTLLEPERQLAEAYGVSRPVVHRAMLRLESKGLVTIMPRKGIRVNDYQKSAKLSLLENIINLDREAIDPILNLQMFSFVEEIFTNLVLNVSTSFLPQSLNIQTITTRGIYEWMQQFAIANGNPIYTMLLNEFELGIINSAYYIIGSDRLDEFVSLTNEIDFFVADRKFLLVKTRIQALFKLVSQTNKS